jgi:hypothetical protein
MHEPPMGPFSEFTCSKKVSGAFSIIEREALASRPYLLASELPT